MAPKVNILIANHNYGEWLEGCIKSALNQDYQNIMITVIDDGSDDNSWELIQSFYTEANEPVYDGVTILSRSGFIDKIPFRTIRLSKRTGPSNARNVGIELTLPLCDIYAILDADDEFYPTKISRCVAELAQTSLIGATYADYHILDTESGLKAIEFKESFSRDRLLQNCIVHSGAVITKQALVDSKDEFGFYDANMRTCEDYDLWMRISEKFMITHIAEPLTLVRTQPKNSTNTVSTEIWQQNWQRISLKLKSRESRSN